MIAGGCLTEAIAEANLVIGWSRVPRRRVSLVSPIVVMQKRGAQGQELEWPPGDSPPMSSCCTASSAQQQRALHDRGGGLTKSRQFGASGTSVSGARRSIRVTGNQFPAGSLHNKRLQRAGARSTDASLTASV